MKKCICVGQYQTWRQDNELKCKYIYTRRIRNKIWNDNTVWSSQWFRAKLLKLKWCCKDGEYYYIRIGSLIWEEANHQWGCSKKFCGNISKKTIIDSLLYSAISVRVKIIKETELRNHFEVSVKICQYLFTYSPLYILKPIVYLFLSFHSRFIWELQIYLFALFVV